MELVRVTLTKCVPESGNIEDIAARVKQVLTLDKFVTHIFDGFTVTVENKENQSVSFEIKMK